MIKKKNKDDKSIEQNIQKMAEINLRNIIKTNDEETVNSILNLYRQLNIVYSELKKARISEYELRSENIKLHVQNESLQSMVDRLTAMLDSYKRELDTVYDNLEIQAKGKMEADFRQAMAEAMEHKLYEALNNALDRIPQLGREEKEIIKESLQKDQIFNIQQLMQILSSARGLVQKPTTIKEGETK